MGTLRWPLSSCVVFGSLYGAFFVKPVRRGLSFFLVSFFVRSGARFFVPTHKSQTLSRAGAVKVGRRANVAAGSIIARPYLDGSEHDGTLGVVGMTLSRGARLVGARIAPHACIRRVSYDPNHDAVMRIGCEAPRRRTHSISRHQSHAAGRDPATSNCHRRPIAKRANRPEVVMVLQRYPFSVRDAGRRPRAPRHRGRSATRRSGACAPRPRSSSCASPGRSRCELGTIESRRCPFGTGETARLIGSIPAGPERCRLERAPSPGVCSRFRRASP